MTGVCSDRMPSTSFVSTNSLKCVWWDSAFIRPTHDLNICHSYMVGEEKTRLILRGCLLSNKVVC